MGSVVFLFFNQNFLPTGELEEYKSDVLKTAYASLAILLTEAARHDLDTFKLKTVLEGYNLDISRISPIIEAYQSGKGDLQTRLSTIGTNLPHIVDVRWRLDLRIEVNFCEYSEILL